MWQLVGEFINIDMLTSRSVEEVELSNWQAIVTFDSKDIGRLVSLFDIDSDGFSLLG